MEKNKELAERRQYRRFTVRAETFYFHGPGSAEPGEIIDIGLGGIAFYHVASQEWPPADSFAFGALLDDHNDIIIDQLPVKSVSVQAVAPGLPGTSTTVWRCSLQFGDTTAIQQEALKNFILTHTTGEA